MKGLFVNQAGVMMALKPLLLHKFKMLTHVKGSTLSSRLFPGYSLKDYEENIAH